MALSLKKMFATFSHAMWVFFQIVRFLPEIFSQGFAVVKFKRQCAYKFNPLNASVALI